MEWAPEDLQEVHWKEVAVVAVVVAQPRVPQKEVVVVVVVEVQQPRVL